MTCRSKATSIAAWVVALTLSTSTVQDPQAKPASPSDLYPIDGDTLVYAPFGRVQERIRIIGVDTPERNPHCRCVYECRAAERATQFVQTLLNNGEVFSILKTGKLDKYGRTLAYVYVGESAVDLAALLVQSGLGVYYDGHSKRKDWCKESTP